MSDISTNHFFEEMNSNSGRRAIYEDDAVSAWIYLTIPNSYKPCSDCWIFNRIDAPLQSELSKYKNGPPPACADYIGANSKYMGAIRPEISFLWSKDGNAVAVLVDGDCLGFLNSTTKQGNSRNIVYECPWGKPWNSNIYQETFGSVSK